MRATREDLLFGAAGGIAATIVIDLTSAVVMPLMGLPATSAFSVIGDTAAGFFALVDVHLAGGAPLGAIVHYLIGLVLGALFVAAAVGIPAFRLTSVRRGVGLGILCTEVVSLPILATPPLILPWDVTTTLQWFGFSFVLHAIWGTVLGAAVAYRLGRAGRQQLVGLR